VKYNHKKLPFPNKRAFSLAQKPFFLVRKESFFLSCARFSTILSTENNDEKEMRREKNVEKALVSQGFSTFSTYFYTAAVETCGKVEITDFLSHFWGHV
jgi:hypothetical protein